MNDRTHIAALALQGIVGATDEGGRSLAPPKRAARDAVKYADALLAELAKIPPPAEQPEEKGGDGKLPVADRPAGDVVRGSTAVQGRVRAALGPEAATFVRCHAFDCPNKGEPDREVPLAYFCALHMTSMVLSARWEAFRLATEERAA